MTRARTLLALLVLLPALAGCTSEEPGAGNFTLEPQAIGWYVGEEATFRLTLEPSVTRSEPRFEIDRSFALEEILFNEQGASFGGDFRTRDPDDLGLRLSRGGVEGESFVLDTANPSVDIHLRIPDDLRDSSYVLELQLFEVGWIESEPFRVDVRSGA